MERTSMAHPISLLCTLTFLIFFNEVLTISASTVPLQIGFYQSTCPLAEKIVRRTITKAIAKDQGLAASLIRMHFHDCFVRGCDASVLLDSTPESRSEKESLANNPSLRGYEAIDEAKAAVEAHCPQTVSCADIIAFAARDSVLLTGGARYTVPAGRRDGTVSIESDANQDIPPPILNADQLVQRFAVKGLSAEDMVVLSGAHSIGTSHCSSFNTRLYEFNSTHPQDPSMDRRFATFLKTQCPPSSKTVRTGAEPLVPLDISAPNHLDVKYYRNLLNGKGLLASDQTLTSSPVTAGLVAEHVKNPVEWKSKFAAAMVRMGYVEVLTGGDGEVRKDCKLANKY